MVDAEATERDSRDAMLIAARRPSPGVVFPLQAGAGPLAPVELVRSLLSGAGGLPRETRVALCEPGGPALVAVWQGTLGELADRAAAQVAQPVLLRLAAPVPAASGEGAGPLPLAGRRVLVTRTLEEAGDAAWELARLGAESVVLPCIEIRPVDDDARLEQALGQAAARYDDLIVTSLNGARALCRVLQRAGLDPGPTLDGLRVVSVGPRTTEELERLGVRVDMTAGEHSGEGLVRELLAPAHAGPRRALLPRALEAPGSLPRALAAGGWQVDDLPAYRTARPELEPEPLAGWLAAAGLDAALFASPSAFRNFRLLLGPARADALLQATAAVLAIGPTTARAIEETGLKVAAVPGAYTMPALIATLVALLGGAPEPLR